MSILPQLLINGIIAGALYALVSSGFSLVFSTCKFINFSHGAIITVSAYFFYFLFSILGFDIYISALFSIGLTVFIGYIVNLLVYKKLRKRKTSKSVLLVASLALLVLLQSLIQIIFGADTKIINFIKITEGITIFGAIITPLQIIIVATSFLLLFSLLFLMKATKIGKAMRAVADNKDAAEIVGISSERIYSWSFIFSSMIAGIAGVLIGLEQNLEPTMGTGLIIKGFAAAIIGGVGSIPGAILGAFLLGIGENFGAWFLPSGYKDAIAFFILFLFLLFRPGGILNIKKEGDKLL